MDSSSANKPNPEFYLRKAKKLIKAIKAGDPLAIQRARAVYHDTREISDAEVPNLMGLQRCQHVIAKENQFNSWADLKHAWEHSTQVSGWVSYMNSGHYRVITRFHSTEMATLKDAATQGFAPALVQYMLINPAILSWGHNSIATRQQCSELFAWTFNILKSQDVSIGTSGQISLHNGLFTLQPIDPEEYAGIQQFIEDDSGTDWMPGMED